MVEPPRTAPETRGFFDSQLFELTKVRLREFYREPEALFWTFIFPILMAVALGIAFRSKPDDTVKIAVLARGPQSERLLSTLKQGSGLLPVMLSEEEAARALRAGDVALVVTQESAGRVEYRFDPLRPDARLARRSVDAMVQHAAGRIDPVAVQEVTVTEPGSRYIDFLLPGLLGMNLMSSGIWGLGFMLVDLRRKKLLKRLIATPMSRAQFLASFLIARLCLLVLEVAVLVAFGRLAFDVPLRGSLPAFALLVMLGSLTFGGLGLLISSRVSTVEGASGLMNLTMLPMWLFSGVFFASSNFPDTLQPLIKLLPLTAVTDSLRAHMLRGASLASLAPELGVIGAWTIGSYFLALRLFRWR